MAVGVAALLVAAELLPGASWAAPPAGAAPAPLAPVVALPFAAAVTALDGELIALDRELASLRAALAGAEDDAELSAMVAELERYAERLRHRRLRMNDDLPRARALLDGAGGVRNDEPGEQR